MQRLLPPLARARCSSSHTRTFFTRNLTQFKVVEHTLPSQHTRHYPGGVEPGHDNELRLAVKQYVPTKGPAHGASSEAVTLIGAHANGFPKELYEPLWEDVHERLASKGVALRSIWIADMVPQGDSGVLNEHVLGDDPNWWDHARDLLFLINQKQGEMPQPLMGVGHSVGAAHLAALSLLHPSLLQALVLVDPVIQLPNPSMTFAPPSTYRRDVWPSRRDAVSAFRKSKFYQSWDPRVLNKWLEYGLRELPTALYPGGANGGQDEKAVTLKTTKAQEVFQYLRPLYKSDPYTDKTLYADFDPEVLADNPHFYRPEPRQIFSRLPEIYPPVHYIFGTKSAVNTAELRRAKLENTGTGIGGNGGLAAGQVSSTILECGHLVSMEATEGCATAAATFIHDAHGQYLSKKQKFERDWFSKPRRERIAIDEDWKHHIGPQPERIKR